MIDNSAPATKTPTAAEQWSAGSYGAWLENLEPAPAAGDAADRQRPMRSVGFTISSIGYAIARRFHELLEPLGLEPRELGLLRTVASGEGLAQQTIAERIGLPPSRMVALVDTLEDRGLLERRRNREDRRAHAVYLTPQGREVLGRAFAIAVEQEQRLTGELNDEEREQLLQLIARVGVHVGIPPEFHAGMRHSAMADE